MYGVRTRSGSGCDKRQCSTLENQDPETAPESRDPLAVNIAGLYANPATSSNQSFMINLHTQNPEPQVLIS